MYIVHKSFRVKPSSPPPTGAAFDSYRLEFHSDRAAEFGV